MNKEILISRLRKGEVLEDILPLSDGQECLIFKANKFTEGDDILYIPDVFLNEIPYNRPCESMDDIREIVRRCYTGDDFLALCNGHGRSAVEIFNYIDWQHPSSAIDEIEEIDSETGEWREWRDLYD